MLHQLIDRDDPKCLYCNSDVNVGMSSESIFNGYLSRLDKETLTCRKCKEIFQIHSEQSDDGITFYTGLLFSCNGIFVFSRYNDGTFFLSKNDFSVLDSHPVKIPNFNVDFSNKKKLYEKLKTYLVFS